MSEKKIDLKLSLILTLSCAAAIILIHAVYWPEVVDLFHGFFAVADVVLIAGFVAASVWVIVNDIDAGPRILAVLLTVIILGMVGITSGQYRQDKKAGITKLFYNDHNDPAGRRGLF